MIFHQIYFFFGTAGQKPKITRELTDSIVTVMGTATMSCEIDFGEPKGKVTWYKDAREVYQGKKYNMMVSKNEAKLEILQADLSDTSVYRIEVDNKLGRVESEAKLTVQGMFFFLTY